MNTFVIEEFFVEEDNTCNFYTVRFENSDVSETDRFYDRFAEDEEFYDDFGIIHALINELGSRGMKLIRRVRDESKAYALPPEGLIKDVQINCFQNKLRLYYVQISDDIVILLGGGIAHDKNSSNPPPAFWNAQMFAKKILSAGNDSFEIHKNKIFPINNDDNIIIY